MNKNNFIKQLKFSGELVNEFNLYTDRLENYFKDEKNRENNKELYDFYCQLKENVICLSKRYGVLKK